jgi:hypothetical protein
MPADKLRPEPDRPVEPPVPPRGGKRPYPVDDPGIASPEGPGSEPDYLPDGPAEKNEPPPTV